jgi:hypothetical protein
MHVIAFFFCSPHSILDLFSPRLRDFVSTNTLRLSTEDSVTVDSLIVAGSS